MTLSPELRAVDFTDDFDLACSKPLSQVSRKEQVK